MDNENKRNLYQIFSKYAPNEIEKAFFDTASNIKVLYDKNLKACEIEADLPSIVTKNTLYAFEKHIIDTYSFSQFRFHPHYPSFLFSDAYISEIIKEAKRSCVAVSGFFDNYEYSRNEQQITFKVPFSKAGINLLDIAKVKASLQNLLKKEFSLVFDITIESSDSFSSAMQENARARETAIQNALKEAATRVVAKPAETEEPKKEELNLTKVISLFDGSEMVDKKSETQILSGKITFDLSEPSLLEGNLFPFSEFIPLRAITHATPSVSVLGEVATIDMRDIRRSNKKTIVISLTDLDTSIYVKMIAESEEAANALMEKYGKGTALAIRGKVSVDQFDGELYVTPFDILKISRVFRKDKADEKRVELHIHSNLSAMDAIPAPEKIVKTASKWGHKAIAITDHGNLQGFPRVMETVEKLGNIKPIYGMEAYYVDDTARAAYGGEDRSFDDEFVVFDIETTGLSVQTCKIIEIGAVLVKKGEVLSRLDIMVDPEEPIPPAISELTGITDDMVRGQTKIKDALKQFLDFAGNRMLVAHNANFDTSFIRKASVENGFSFTNSYLDTVAMSRYVNPELKNHKLDRLAEYFDLGDFDHHRADADAEMLSIIFFRMVEKLEAEGILSVSGLSDAMGEKADPLKLKTRHLIILVKNSVGLKHLYQLVSDSYLSYYRYNPRIPKTRLAELREGLILGSACVAGELYQAMLDDKPEDEIKNIAKFYDYLEIQPVSNNEFLIRNGTLKDIEAVRNVNRRIVALGKELGIPVVATCDAHYIDPEDDIYRQILLSGQKFSDADEGGQLYFRTTEEMLEEFSYLGEETAYEVVVKNTNLIADMIGEVRPVPKGNYPPHIEGSEEELTNKCWSLAKELYGDPLPEIVKARLERELDSIIKNGFAIMYIIAKKLVDNSEEKGYQVGSRGSVGSSFVATMAGITRVNPLPPHYRCPKCKYTHFFTDGSVKSGFDLPSKECPECGTTMCQDGHDIPFETFLGFNGDKTPDIDLNFSGDVQGDAHRFTEVLFGKGHAFKAGTIGTLASKTAYGFAMKYLESKGIMVNKAEIDRLCSGCEGIKRTTGQHPGGIIVIPDGYDVTDFTPVQHPADDPHSDIVTTHFEFKYLHDTILKLDILGHDIPTKYKRLEEYTGLSVLDVPMNDPKVYKLFTSTEPLGVKPEAINSETGTLGLPEMGTRMSRGVLTEAKPQNFSDLLQIEGLTHGTGVWMGNAEELIKDGICTISDVIGCRDDIMMTLIHKYGVEKGLAFKIMEFTRKNKKGLPTPPEMVESMVKANVPQWYIDSLQKIRYMFPKAHAAAYATDAIRLGWYKVYHPVEFYAAYFTAAPDGFDSEIVLQGPRVVRETMDAISKMGRDASQKDKELADALLLVNEYFARGYQFLPVDLQHSHATKFLPENGKIRVPFNSLPKVGTTVSENIMKARDENDIQSIDMLKSLARVPKSVIEVLQRNGAFTGLSETDQLSMF